MIVPAALAQRYSEVEPHLEPLRLRVRDIIQGFTESHGYPVTSRVKRLGSVAEKVETGRFATWNDLDDLVGLTVVVPTLVDEPPVLEYLQASFDQVSLKRKGDASKPPDQFRFDSTRFVGRLKEIEGVDLAPHLLSTNVEIQVRTAFEHAWAVTTHALAYKNQDISWSTLRLAAQLKASVEQLDMLIVGFSEASKSIPQHKWSDVDDQVRVASFFKEKLREEVIPAEAAPKDWSRFVANLLSAVTDGVRGGRARRERVDRAVEVLGRRLESVNGDRFPRSLSLLQTCIGLLAEERFFAHPLESYRALVTPELTELFPATRALGPTFTL